jgi:hypothetical protein
VSHSKRLSDLLEAVSDERLTYRDKWRAFWRVFAG